MKEFKSLDKRNVNEVEKDIRAYWDKIDILKRSIETRDKGNNFVFIENIDGECIRHRSDDLDIVVSFNF